MKKILLLLTLFLISINVCAKEKVTFSACVDGDTIKVIYNNKEETIRLLSIDTPETVHPTKPEEKYGKEASDYTCKSIKNAKELEIEFDNNSDKKDKYNRYLAWIFVDNKLLQTSLLEKGYASIAYVYGDYKYANELNKAENIAKKNKLGIYSDYYDYTYFYLTFVIVIIFLIIVFGTKKQKKQLTNKITKKIKNSIKNIK